MKLAFVTHAEHPKLRETVPDIWPEFMAHDPVVQSFWPQLYDQYPDFQLWVVDRDAGRRATVGYACSVPVGWNGTPSPRGIDWALTDGVEATPTTLCAIVAGVVPDYRGPGHRRDDPPAARRDRRGSRPRRAGGAGAADVEGPLSARRARPLRRLAARRRPPVRPVATHARAARRRARGDGSALDDDLGPSRGVGGVDGDGVPRGRQLRRAGRPRSGPLQERPRRVRRAQHLDVLLGSRASLA